MNAAPVTVLPAQPAPAVLTAAARASSLGEHLAGFLAANNLRGFAQEMPGAIDPETIAGRLQLIAEGDSHSIWWLKDQAWDIKRLTRGVSHCQVLEIIAAILGYSSWGAIAAREAGPVENRGSITRTQSRLFGSERAPLRQAKREVLRLRRTS